jgi:beta-galactosidase
LNTSRPGLTTGATGTLWSEDLQATGAELLAAYCGGPLDGRPALTRNNHGAGVGWYVSTRLDSRALAPELRCALEDCAVKDIEAVRRHADDGRSWLFLFNHGEACYVPASGLDLLTDRHADGALWLAAGAVAVLREP